MVTLASKDEMVSLVSRTGRARREGQRYYQEEGFTHDIQFPVFASDVARFLWKKILSSLATVEEDNTNSSDPISNRFKAIGEKLKANSPALISLAESIPQLYDLNDTLTEWRILKEQKKKKRIFSFQNMNERSSAFNAKLDELEKLVPDSSTQVMMEPNQLLLDRYTFYKPHRITYIEDEGSDKLERKMIDWLLEPGDDDFKVIGVHGTGGSGKSALVKNVLKQKAVGDKFKLIIWACLSELTCEEEMDVGIMQYLLYRLGLDTDCLVGNVGENKDWLMEQVERRLMTSGDYILVLDGMWRCSEWFTENFLGKLKEKGGGGAVIVTSRRKTVAEQISAKNMLIHLNPLSYKESAFLEIPTSYRLCCEELE